MRRFEAMFLGVVLLLLTVLAFVPVRKNGLVDFDDELYISTNPHVMNGPSWSGVGWAFTNFHGNYWQPLAWLTLQVDAGLFARRGRDGQLIPNAVAIHVHNLCWHCGSVLLCFWLWRWLTGARWLSFLVAGLFAVHPMRVESVAWAAERKDVLSVFFGFATLWAYVWYVAKPGWMRYLVVAAAFALSLMAKPMLVTLPFVLLLLDYWPLRRLWDDPGSSSNPAASSIRGARTTSTGWLLLEKVPLLILAAAVLAVTGIARLRTGMFVSLITIPLSARLGIAATGYGWYLLRTFWPMHLAALYPHPGRDWPVLPALAGFAVLAAVTLLAVWQARQRRWLVIGWLWFIGTLFLVIGLAIGGAQAWADRFSYWPHVGLFVAIAWGLGELVERRRVPAWVCGVAMSVVLGSLAALTWIQVGHWRDTLTLWTQAAAVTRDNDVAHLHLGYYHGERAIYFLDLGIPETAQQHFAQAEFQFAQAVRISPELAVARSRLGQVLLAQGRTLEAAEHLQIAVDCDPRDANAWYDLGIARLRLQEPETAVAVFRKLLELFPADPGESQPDPTKVQGLIGLGLAQLAAGMAPDAEETFLAALALAPQVGDAWCGLGDAYVARGRPDEAVAALRKAIQFGPGLVKAHGDLGLALGRQGQWAEAVSSLREAARMQSQRGAALEKLTGPVSSPGDVPDQVVYLCRLAYAQNHLGTHQAAAHTYNVATQRDPSWPEKFTTRALKLATSADPNRRDPRLAFELASQAAEASSDPPASTLDALAAAQAALGQFPEAVQTAKQALKKAKDGGKVGLADSVEQHLRLYERGEPVRVQSP